MLVRAPHSFLFILAVCCWFRHNAAVPLASHSSNQMQDEYKEESSDSQSDSDDTSLNSRSIRETRRLDSTSEEDDENDENEENDEDDESGESDEKQIPAVKNEEPENVLSSMGNVNRNVNMNMNIFSPARYRPTRHKQNKDINRDRYEQSKDINRDRYGQSKDIAIKSNNISKTEDIATVTEHETLEEIAREEASTNCTSGNKKNQRYSSSFYENATDHALTVEKEFHNVVGNNSKVKRTGSVHEGEDITLCWIETTTIKEDKTIRPPKRLVIREYTISFENSATIPERYLECKRYEGEMTANDPDVGKTALFEIIDEDTMVSRIVNFTSVSHADNVTTWEHKKVKCGVGPVVSKNIVELNDGSKNPKKRVEIKVSPKMHQLTAATTEEVPCTDSTEEIDGSSPLADSTEHITELSCENGVCEATMTSPSISAKNGKEDHTLPTVTESLTLLDEEVSRRSTIFPKILTPIQEYEEKVDCEENPSDPACLTQKHGTTLPGKLFPELIEVSTMEAVVREAAETSIPISDKEIATREEISSSSVEGTLKETTQPLFTSREEKQETDLVIEETTPFTIVTDISVSRPSDQTSIDDSTASVETKFMTDHGATEGVEESSKIEEIRGDSFIELSSDEIDKVPSSSMEVVTSAEIDTELDVTTAMPVEFTEFARESVKPGQSLDKLSEPSISTETGHAIFESSSNEEVPSEESITSAIGTMVELQTSSEEGEFISMSTRMSPTEVKLTTASPATSSEVDNLCENPEECAHVASSEACDEFGNCGKATTRCDSEECFEEEITKDQSRFDTSLPSMATEVPPFATGSQSSEESGVIETQYTTVANVATTMLTSRESVINSTDVNVPFTMDTRRSTTISTPQHKLTLKVKVLLEHINENKEKHSLVEVEKHLSLNENLERHNNRDLLEQLKSLNDSVNMETVSALFNCTSLGNLTRNSNFITKQSGDAVSDKELEFTNSDREDTEQFASEYADAKTDYSGYEEREGSPRRRRSLDNEMEEQNRLVKRDLYDSTDSAVDSFNISTSEQTELIKELSTTTNYSEEETTENERNATKEGDESTTPSTTMSIVDLSNASESHDANLTKEDIQLTTTTNKPEEEASSAVYIEDERNVTNDRNESAVLLKKEGISNETEMDAVRETLPGIQEDVITGLQHMVSQLAQNHLTSIKKIKEAVKTNLLNILADPNDTRIHWRRRRAATEEVGHWSNERIKEVPMGGNLRSLTEFTLYKVLP